MKRFITLSAIILILMSAIVSKVNATSAMNAEFRTMGECLIGIKKSSGNSLKIVTDKPTLVSGFLSNGQGFACERKVTGTKGTYYHGWYLVK